MTNERLDEIDREYAKITDLTGNAEWIPELIAAVRTLTASLAEVTRERGELKAALLGVSKEKQFGPCWCKTLSGTFCVGQSECVAAKGALKL